MKTLFQMPLLAAFVLSFSVIIPINLLGDMETARNPPSECSPETGESCSSCGDESDSDDDNSDSGEGVDNECVKITLNAGRTTAWSDRWNVQLKIFSSQATPSLFTPSMLRVVMGYTFQTLGNERTSRGAPKTLTFVNRAGEALYFVFAEGSSMGIPDPGYHKDIPERLMMVDAEGWATLSEPAYYDLYPGNGECWRFMATDVTKQLGELVEWRNDRGRVLTQEDFGVEVVRDANGELLQLLTASRLSDITLLPETETQVGYTVKVYPIQMPPAFNDAEGRFEIPSGIQTETELTITCGVKEIERNGETVTVKDEHTLHAALKKGGGAVQHYTFVYTNGDWALTRPDGTVKKKEVYYGDNNEAEMITQTLDANGTLLAQKKSGFELYSWGYSKTNSVEGAEGVTRSTSWQYIQSGVNKGKLARVERSNGYWEAYAYDALGRRIRTEMPVSGMPDHPSATKVVTVSYVPVDPNDPVLVNDQRPRAVVETIVGIETKRTYYAYPTNSLGARLEIQERAAEQYAAYGATNSLRSITAYYSPSADPLFAGRLDYSQSEDGSVQKYDYLFGNYDAETGTFTSNPEGSYWCQSVTKLHVWNNMQPVPMKTTRTISVYTPSGNRVFEVDQLFGENDKWLELSHKRYTFNLAGKIIRTETNNGFVTETEWGANCCGKSLYINEQGIRTTYQYDMNGRLVTQTLLDPSPVETHIAYDSFGRQISTYTTNRVAQIGTPVLETRYDILNRITAQSDVNGNYKVYSYTENESMKNLTYPSGFVRTWSFGIDNKLHAETETDIHSVVYTYGVNIDGTQWSCKTQGARWIRTTTDFFGRVLRVEYPGFSNTFLQVENAYNLTNLTAVYLTSIDSNNVRQRHQSTLYTYEPDGRLELTINDFNCDGIYDPMTDIASRNDVFYILSEGNLWQKITQTLFVKNQARILGSTQSQISNLPLCTSYKYTDGYGLRTFIKTFTDRASQRVVETVTQPDFYTNSTVRVVQSGLLLSEAQPSGVISIYGYDGIGRKVTETDALEKVTTYVYNKKGQIVAILSPSGERVTYNYNDLGQVISETDSLTNTIYNSYNLHGRVIRRFGDTYPVEYVYDLYGQKVALKTWRDLNSSVEETKWLFDERTGLLLSKKYPNGQGPSYTYTPDRKILTRTWARGVVTTYTYEPDGQISSIVYSDDTPSVFCTYNEWRLLENVTDAAGTTTFIYNDFLLPITESINGVYPSRTIYMRYIYNRIFSYGIDNPYSVIYGYDMASGRLCSMDSPGGTFLWQYFSGTDLKKSLYYPSGASVQWDYDMDKKALKKIKNYDSSGFISEYSYGYDSAGRCISLATSGFAFSPFEDSEYGLDSNGTPVIMQGRVSISDEISYGYNRRDELIRVTSRENSLKNQEYEFDESGNRIFILENQNEQTSYDTNELNQYTVISSSSVQGSSGSFEPIYDADGNQTLIQTSTGIWNVSYNGENRPVVWIQGDTRIEMSYDRQGRRVSYKNIHANSVVRYLYFLYKEYVCIQEIDASTGETLKSYVWDPTEPIATRPLEMTMNSRNYYYMVDANKNVVEVLSSDDFLDYAHYEYSPFGETIKAFGAKVYSNPYRFSSEYHDDELGLVCYNYRHYNPMDGRWVNRDPIEENGGNNLYLFVNNNPLMYYDLQGLMPDFPIPSVVQWDVDKLRAAQLEHERRVTEAQERITKKNKSDNSMDCPENGTTYVWIKIPRETKLVDRAEDPLFSQRLGFSFSTEKGSFQIKAGATVKVRKGQRLSISGEIGWFSIIEEWYTKYDCQCRMTGSKIFNSENVDLDDNNRVIPFEKYFLKSDFKENWINGVMTSGSETYDIEEISIDFSIYGIGVGVGVGK